MTQHTLKPWHIEAYGSPVKWLAIKHGQETIARIEAVGTPLDAEGHANARLIAKSPEMFEVLTKILQLHGIPDYRTPSYAYQFAFELEGIVRQLIAEITGASPRGLTAFVKGQKT